MFELYININSKIHHIDAFASFYLNLRKINQLLRYISHCWN